MNNEGQTQASLHKETSYHNNPKYWHWQAWANRADLDQMLQKAASNQGLHCLPAIKQLLDTTSKFHREFMSPTLFLFELLKMSKDHWSCITYLSTEAGKKLMLKMWKPLPPPPHPKKTTKKNNKKQKKHNFKIPRAQVYPQTTSKMPVKFQKHLLKAVGGVVLTRYLLLYALS